jgi:hypothetical protein
MQCHPNGYCPAVLGDYGGWVGDGRTFDQALRALDKLIAERAQARPEVPDPYSPVRRAYERIINATPQFGV